MQWTYFNEDERVVEELEDVLAVLPETTEDLTDPTSRFGLPTTNLLNESAVAFERAGWIFVRPNNEVRQAFNQGDAVPGATAVGKVFMQPDGRILIGTQQTIGTQQSTAPRDDCFPSRPHVTAGLSADLTAELPVELTAAMPADLTAAMRRHPSMYSSVHSFA